MTPIAWLVVAAILIAWAAEAIWQHIDRRRDERDWQAMVDEAEAKAAKWHSAYRAMERGANEMRRKAARMQDELDLARQTVAAVVLHGEKRRATPTAVTADLPPSDLGKRRAAKRAVSKS